MKARELLQELSSMIAKDKHPTMDGSHRLDHWKANRLIIQINNELREIETELRRSNCLTDKSNCKHENLEEQMDLSKPRFCLDCRSEV
jgi:hypothetical protein